MAQEGKCWLDFDRSPIFQSYGWKTLHTLHGV